MEGWFPKWESVQGIRLSKSPNIAIHLQQRIGATMKRSPEIKMRQFVWAAK